MMRGYSVVGELHARAGGAKVQVTRLSLDDASLRAGEGRELGAGDRVSIELADLAPIAATVARVEKGEATCDFTGLDVGGARELARLIDRLLARRALRGEPARFNEGEV